MESQPQPAAAPTAPAVADTGVKSYINMISLAFFAGPTGLARAYRGEQIGWIRFWIYVGGTVLMIVPFLNILAFLALIVVSIWGVVDFFMVYNLRTDAAGQPLHATARDQVWAKNMKTVYIVMLALAGLFILLGLLFGAAILSNIGNYSPYSTPRSYYGY